MIASNEKRLSALPARCAPDQKRSQISKIRNFQRQAQEALKSGDAEGAKTLATKAGCCWTIWIEVPGAGSRTYSGQPLE